MGAVLGELRLYESCTGSPAGSVHISPIAWMLTVLPKPLVLVPAFSHCLPPLSFFPFPSFSIFLPPFLSFLFLFSKPMLF